jgi:hypothetical protein
MAKKGRFDDALSDAAFGQHTGNESFISRLRNGVDQSKSPG